MIKPLILLSFAALSATACGLIDASDNNKVRPGSATLQPRPPVNVEIKLGKPTASFNLVNFDCGTPGAALTSSEPNFLLADQVQSFSKLKFNATMALLELHITGTTTGANQTKSNDSCDYRVLFKQSKDANGATNLTYIQSSSLTLDSLSAKDGTPLLGCQDTAKNLDMAYKNTKDKTVQSLPLDTPESKSVALHLPKALNVSSGAKAVCSQPGQLRAFFTQAN